MSYAVGFDIGGSTIRAGLVALDEGAGTLDHEIRVALSPADREPETIVGHIASIVRRLASVAHGPLVGVGVGIAAQMSADGRVAVGAPNLFRRDVPIADLVESALPGYRVLIANDLNAILAGEARFGAARNLRDVVALYAGTGLGGAVMVGGEIALGAFGVAGEIGHTYYGGDALCGCGATGCLETIVGGPFVAARYAERSGEHVGPDVIDARAAAGEDFAVALWDEVCDALAGTAATLVSFLNPELVLLGGGVLTRTPALVARLRNEIPRRAAKVCASGLRVELGALEHAAGVLGAAALLD